VILKFPILNFQPDENITVRLGTELADRFGSGDLIAEIHQLGNPVQQATADIVRAEVVPFTMIQQSWIDQASYPGVKDLDSLYNLLSQYYGQFDCEALMSVIYSVLRM